MSPTMAAIAAKEERIRRQRRKNWRSIPKIIDKRLTNRCEMDPSYITFLNDEKIIVQLERPYTAPVRQLLCGTTKYAVR